MRTTLLTASAVAALMTITPVLAQDATTPVEPPPAADQMAPPVDQTAPPATDQAPADQAPANQATPPADATAPATSPDSAATTEATQPKFIAQQEDSELLASSLMGKTVYNPADESLGKINDLVFAKEGGIQAVVVGVGGFLGIGEKNVAVSYGAVQATTTQDDGSVKLVLDTTKEELEAAPAYTTVAMKLQEEQQRAQEQQMDQGTVQPIAPAPTQ